MSAISHFRLILGMAALLFSASAQAAHYKVFLLGGQSNMVGTGTLTTGLPVALQSPQPDILFYHYSSTALTTLQPGSGQSFGPEITFGRTIADAFSSENFCLIKYAVGGSDLTTAWDPSAGISYAGFRAKVADGLAALTTTGHTYEIVGMLWTQGERDARIGRTTAQYEFDLNEFIADIRIRYGTNLPFFLNRLSVAQTDIPNITPVRTAQENVAAADPFAYLIDSDALTVNTDLLHFDAAGQIDLGEAFASSYINSRVPDTTDPLTDTLSPTNAATDVSATGNLVITFNESVAFGSGNISLRQSGGALIESFDVANPPAGLTRSGATVTINPTADLTASTGYYVEIDATAIDDLAGNSFAGFSGNGTWSFTTAAGDTTAPLINTLSPTNGATGVSATGNLVITFNESVAFGSGNISLRQSGGALIESFDVANPPAGLTRSGASVTINPTANLTVSTGYYVEIDTTAIDDLAGNSFAGFSSNGTWSFTVAAAPSTGGLITTGITATASSFINANTAPSKTIDNSGMNQTTGEHSTATQTSWNSAVAGPLADQWIQWDLGSTYVLGSIQVWNYNDVSRYASGIKQLDIYVSSLASPGDPEGAGSGDWTQIGTNVTMTIAPHVGTYTGFDLEAVTGISLPDTAVRHVRFEVNSTFFADGVGGTGLSATQAALSEIRFFEASAPPSNTFTDWIGGFSGLNGLTGFGDDADGDGIKNGVEAFFGTAPNAPNAGLSAVAINGNALTFTHPEVDSPLTNVSGSYEWSLDLSAWNASGDDVGGTIVTIGAVQDTPEPGTTTVTASVTGTAPNKVFVRAVVTQD